MKGIVFTEFLDMVESRYGLDMTDRIIGAARLPHAGAYTAVGNYPHGELLRLVAALAEATGDDPATLVRQYGEYLFPRFASHHPQHGDCFAFLRSIEAHIHTEVRKLYPDAELPSFDYSAPNADELVVDYRSPRSLADLAEGLILGCIQHYREAIRLSRSDLPPENGEQHTRFHLVRQRP